ncbi:hypothetical protein [Cryptosporidium parvum Iowa II]|uniref:Uncharacterized low complexity protein n=2 Tax=Cryptosporidium parvum TaxID=5807 RepID=Q5CYC6_CRYPI|nr:hypothetical protein [Cryptosporidium parvum Iowa II]EAK90299.1 uncharacterized low complexity protein [Cryptosporidium parvum Iowa II]
MREIALNNIELERRPNWWRGSESENILDPYFKKPIYSGKSKFNFFPKFLKDNMKWFKNRIPSNNTNDDYSQLNEYDKKAIIEFSKQQKITQGQESSRYKYISPYSEYLLERLKWKIALRIYYTLDPNDKGYIELEHSKKLLFEMLKVDTEKAQTLLLLLETIKPFYAKDGCVEKNDIIIYLAREIFDDTRGYGLFSKLNNIFKNPISRSKKRNNDCFINGFQDVYMPNKKQICFSSDPNAIKLNETNVKQSNSKDTNYNCTYCQNKNKACITCKMKKNCTGKLRDHIKISEDRKRKLIERIKEEKKEINDKNMLECTFKPEILWPIGKFINKNNKSWLKNKKNLKGSKLPQEKKNEICGYEIINEQNIEDKNIQVFLNQGYYFDSLNNWNGYIHDSITNQVYVIHKGYFMDDHNVDKNEIFYRKTDKEEQKEIRNKMLDSIMRKINIEFQTLENNENGNEKKKSLNFGTKKLVDKLRAERETGTNDPRLNTPEFTIEVNHPEFVEKIVDFSEIKPYKNVTNHEDSEIKREYSTSPCYYYLPRGYERIGNCFNEIRFRRKLDFLKDSVRDNRNIDTNNSSNLKVKSNSFINKEFNTKNSSLCLDEKPAGLIEDTKMSKIFNKSAKIDPSSLKDLNKIVGAGQSKNVQVESLGGLKKNNGLDQHLLLKSPSKNETNIIGSHVNDESDFQKGSILATKFKKELEASIKTKNSLKVSSKIDSSIHLIKKEADTSIQTKSNLKIPPIKKEADTSIQTKSKLKIPPKKDLSTPPVKKEADTSIQTKSNLKIPPKKDFSTPPIKKEADTSIQTKSNIRIPPKKDFSTPPIKKEADTSIQTKSNLKIPPVKKEADTSIQTKSNLKVPPKKDFSTPPIKKEADTLIQTKKSLVIPPKKDSSVPVMSKEADTPIPIKNNLKIPSKINPSMPPIKRVVVTSTQAMNCLKIPQMEAASVPPIKKEVDTSIQTKKSLIIPPKKDASVPVMNKEADTSIQTKSNLKIPPKKDLSTPPVKKEADTSIQTKSNLKIPPKKDFSTPPVKKETDTSIQTKSNLKIPPKKDFSTPPVKKEADTSIQTKSNLKIPPKKDFSTPPVKKEADTSIQTKSNLKIPPKKDFSTPPVKKEADTSIQTKSNLKIPPKKDFSTPPIKKEADTSIQTKSNLKIPPKKDFSTPPVNKEADTSIQTKSNLKIPPKKDFSTPPIKKEADTSIQTKSNLKIPPKKDFSTPPVKKEADTSIQTKSNIRIPPKKDFSTPPIKKEADTSIQTKSNLKIPPKKNGLVTSLN